MGLQVLKKTINCLWLPLTFFILSCSVPERRPCFQDNQDCSKIGYYIDREDWDSFYLRGCAYIDCNCLELAIEVLNKAIDERPRDKMRARTYGLHFIRYFPHRELGIIYFQRGQIQEAIEELERSLQDSPSSKGKYFLNQARKAWLLKNDLDHYPPTIHLTSPKGPFYYTNQSKIHLEGYAEDDQFVSGLSIIGEPIFIELSAKTIRFAQTIPLEPGKNFITIATYDFLERVTEKRLEIIVDKTGPFIYFTHPPLETAWLDGGVMVKGIAFDDSGMQSLIINGQIMELKDKKTVEFSHWIPLTKDLRQITLLAKDIAGNETRGHIDLSCVEKSSRLFRFFDGHGGMAQTARQSKKGVVTRMAALDGPTPCLVSSNFRRGIGKGPYREAARPFFQRSRLKSIPCPGRQSLMRSA